MESLRDQAQAAGGRVVSLLGNHEVTRHKLTHQLWPTRKELTLDLPAEDHECPGGLAIRHRGGPCYVSWREEPAEGHVFVRLDWPSVAVQLFH
jgi:hypothetical protein